MNLQINKLDIQIPPLEYFLNGCWDYVLRISGFRRFSDHRLACKFYLNLDVESLKNSTFNQRPSNFRRKRFDPMVSVPPNACFLCFILWSLMSESYNFTMRLLQYKKTYCEHICRLWKLNFSSLGFPQKYIFIYLMNFSNQPRWADFLRQLFTSTVVSVEWLRGAWSSLSVNKAVT